MTITERLEAIVFNILPQDEGFELKPETNFKNDMYADSLDDVEMVMAVEEEFNLLISDDEAMKCATFGDAVTLVERMSNCHSPESEA